MNEPGLTHLSFFVDDLGGAMAAVERWGGTVRTDTNLTVAVMIEDPDGQLIELVVAEGRFRDNRNASVAALDAKGEADRA
jgi:hypothetical protein